MEAIQEQLNTVLGNPELMQQIMSMAQTLQSDTPKETPQATVQDFGGIDLATIQKISSFASKSNIDSNQKNLLQALTPYLNGQRIAKLEKAMRAARLANLASAFLSSSGLFSGR